LPHELEEYNALNIRKRKIMLLQEDLSLHVPIGVTTDEKIAHGNIFNCRVKSDEVPAFFY
jgi:hypothetical protein